jgi:hypothetical protein
MKLNQPFVRLAILLSALLGTSAQAEETAVVRENHVNVRGQASLIGEVITQLQKGEQVTILEEISVPNPNPNPKSKAKAKANESAKWARIRMPANTPVWLFAPFVDSTNKTVKVPRLNLRAGPGENYSVVGRLERGDTFKDIRTLDQWMEIETPVNAYAFVATEFLTKTSTNAPPAPANPEKTVPAPVIAAIPAKTEPEPIVTPAAPPPLVVTNVPIERPPLPGAEPAANPVKTEIVRAAPAPAPAVVTNTPALPVPAVELPPLTVTSSTNVPAPVTTPPTVVAQPLPKRIVRREGIVRSTRSIQAPTYFELVHPVTGKVINYLHTDDPALGLKSFKGQKILVAGEEGIDPRWPNTPLIEIQSIDLAP